MIDLKVKFFLLEGNQRIYHIYYSVLLLFGRKSVFYTQCLICRSKRFKKKSEYLADVAEDKMIVNVQEIDSLPSGTDSGECDVNASDTLASFKGYLDLYPKVHEKQGH